MTMLFNKKIELNVFSNVYYLNNDEFNQILLKNNDKMLFMKQMHFVTHNAICFKYKSKQDKCRFDMLKNIVPRSLTDKHDVIQIKRNNDWINSFNHVFASCFWSNHDISWIVIIVKSFIMMYYIINYITKNDFNFNQILLKTVLMKKIFEHSQKKH